jgi:hypothetical protein
MLTLHEDLEKQGPRVVPEAETVEDLVARRGKRSRVELVALAAAAAGTLVVLDELGIAELPEGLVLGALAFVTLVTLADWFRRKDEDDDA